MVVNNAIRTMIRENKTHQIETVMQTTPGMQTMDSAVSSFSPRASSLKRRLWSMLQALQ